MSSLDRLGLGEELHWEPRRLVFPGPWSGHIPFAFWLIKALRPASFVELGTHTGNSYSAFCQAIQTLAIPTTAFAVDTWQGDPHAGGYGEEVFGEFNAFNGMNYAAFSTLLRTTFDEARPYFADASIDLLHIDGMHTYEAVRQDFETWESALSSRAVVLFHDTNVRERDFGVWRLWEELSARYPSFEFHHSHGLGVLAYGTELPLPAKALFDYANDLEISAAIRRRFAERGETFQQKSGVIELQHRLAEIEPLQAALAQREAEIAILGAASDWREALLSANGEIIAGRDALLRLREEELKARDSMIRVQNERITGYLDELRVLRARDARSSSELVGLSPDLAAARTEIERVNREYASLLAGIETEREQTSQRQASEIANLHHSYRSSTSWRLTMPVRRSARLASRMGRATGRLLSSRSSTSSAMVEPESSIVHDISAVENVTVQEADEFHVDAKSTIRAMMANRLEAFFSSVGSLHLPSSPDPDVSIILVLYNQAELTYACLASICECLSGSKLTAEVIILDNGSTDTTAKLLDRIDGAKIVRSYENLHFLRGVNRAADEASGRHILLLNNDAQLTPGSLEAAVSLLDRDATVGAVGGRLILPDGSLQEAGSIIWWDGTCLGYGRGRNAEEPEFMFRRDVDYCSGAFLMTPRVLFERLNRFDERYAPAYYEETDYCVRVREEGLRVVFEPDIVTIHFEFGSAAASSDALSLQQRNWRTFRQRHAHWLSGQYTASDDTALHARSSRFYGPRVLFLEDRVPHPALGAGYPRANDMLSTMAADGAAVTLFPMFHHSETWEAIRRSLPPEIEVIINGSANSLRKFLDDRRGFYDLIVVCRPHNMEAFERIVDADPDLLGDAKIIYDAEAIFARRQILKDKVLELDGAVDEGSDLVAREITLARRADTVISVSEAERKIFLDHGLSRVQCLGHKLEAQPTRASFDERSDIVFLGAIHGDSSPNADSLRWFASDILPELRSQLKKDIRLKVIGLVDAPSIKALDGNAFDLIGPVDDLSEPMNKARLVIVPTRFAAGIPHKAHQVTAFGVPIVATDVIASQLGWTPGEDLLAESDPHGFARACATLYQDALVWERVRSNALHRLELDCSPEAFRSTVDSLLRLATPRDRKSDIVATAFRISERGVVPGHVGRPAEADYALAVPFAYMPQPIPRSVRAAAIIHIFYDDLAGELLSYLDNVPIPLDLYISTDSEEKKERIEATASGWTKGGVMVQVVPNRGRDIAPKLIAFKDVYESYEYVVHLHSKASFHDRLLAPWRRFLLENLLGSRAVVASILETFIRHPNVGIVAPQHYEYVRRWLNWGGNFTDAKGFAARIGLTLSPTQALDFPSGSMFWARTAALRPLLDLDLSFDDFPEEGSQTDGTLAHVIERMYFFGCEAAGYDWLKVARPTLFLDPRTTVTIRSEAVLESFVREHTVVLSGPSPIPTLSEPPRMIDEVPPGLIKAMQKSFT